MLRFGRPRRVHDPVLGELERSRGHWRGALALTGTGEVPLALCDARTEPDPEAVLLARAVPGAVLGWRGAIETALFEHYEPYADAVVDDASDSDEDAPPTIRAPGQVWPHTSFEFVSVTRLDGILVTELGFTVAWDEEHMLGARFHGNDLVELNGSVLPP